MGSSGGGDNGMGLMALMQQGTPMPGLPVAGQNNVTGDPFTYGQFQNFLPDIKEGEKNPTATGLTPDMFNYTKPSQPRDQLAQAMTGGGGGGGAAAAGGGGSADNPYGVAANMWAMMSPSDKMIFNSTMAAHGGSAAGPGAAGPGAGGSPAAGGGGTYGGGGFAGQFSADALANPIPVGGDDAYGANILGMQDWQTFKNAAGADAANAWLNQQLKNQQMQPVYQPWIANSGSGGYGGIGSNMGNANAAMGASSTSESTNTGLGPGGEGNSAGGNY